MIIGNKYFLDDAETGLYEVSKEYYERYNADKKKFYEMFMPKGILEPNGQITMTGTFGEFDDKKKYKELWNYIDPHQVQTT
jgi:hypothetical protein